MTNTIKTAELALGLYFGDVVAPTLKPGRLKNRMVSLSQLIMYKFRRMPKLSYPDRKKAEDAVIQFTDASGWSGRPRSYVTLTNFLLSLYDQRDYGDDLAPILNDIYDYYKRAKKAPSACEWSAAEAAEKWEEIINQLQEK